jgi:hypothetical protein
MKLKYGLHAYWMGWKTRRLISLVKFENLKRQAKEIEEFYKIDSLTGKPDNHVLKARANYADGLINTINSKLWYKNVKNDLTAEQKRAKVKQMRQNNQKPNNTVAEKRPATNDFASTKGINPDNRPIRSAVAYGNDDVPIGGKSVLPSFDDRPIGGGQTVQPKMQTEGAGGMMMAFDFSAPKPKPKAKTKTKKATFLKRGTGVERILNGPQNVSTKKLVEPIEEDEAAQGIPTDSSPKKSEKSESAKKFLKRGDKIKYDPLKAVKEEKLRKQNEEKLKKERDQALRNEIERMKRAGEDPSEMVSMLNYEDDELVNLMSINALDMESPNRKISKEDSIRLAKAEGRRRLSVKNIVSRRAPDKTSAAPAVTGQFQDLKYLKKVPKRVDCWLANNPKKSSSIPRNNSMTKSLNNSSSDQADFSRSTKIFNKLPSNRYVDENNIKNFEDAKKNREEFLKKHGSPNLVKKKTIGNRKSTENFPEMGYLGSPRMEFDGHSIETYGLYQEDSVSQQNPVAMSMHSQDDEKIESLLERLEESRIPEKGFTMKERNMIMEDTQYMAMLTGSETLYRIFQLM